MKYTDAETLLKKYVGGETLLRHCKTVSVAMKYFAQKAGEADPEFWECVGLLHDIDFEKYPDQHCIKCKDIFEAEKANFPDITDELVHAVQSHGWKLCCDVEPTREMEKVLYACDELTGLIGAAALMRPSKSVQDMELKSLKKKFKDKRFAAGCDREVIKRGAEMLGWDLDYLLTETLEAMKTCEEPVEE